MLLRTAFAPLLAAHFLTFLNSNFLKNALILLVLSALSKADGEAMSAFVSATFMLPMIFLSGLGGQLADAVDRRKLGGYLKGAEMAAVAVAVIGVYASSFWLVLAGLVLMQIVGALFGPVRGSLIPDLAGKDKVASANAWIEAASFLAMILGIWLVAIAFSHEGPVRFALASAVLALSAAGFMAINFIPPQSGRDPEGRVDWNILRGTWVVLKEATSSTATRHASIALAWGWFLASLVLSTAPAIVKRIGGDVGTISFGMMVYGVFGVLGAQIAARAGVGRSALGAASIGLVALGGVVAFLGAAAGSTLIEVEAPVVIAAMGFASAAFSFALIPLASAVQTLSETSRRARTIAGSNVMNAVAMVGGGYAVAGAQGLGVDLSTIYLSSGIITVITLSLYASAGRLRSVVHPS